MDTASIVTVRVGATSYQAIVGPDLLSTIGARAAALLRGPRCGIVADSNTAKRYGPVLEASLRAAQLQPVLFTIDAGETSKTLEQAGSICSEMAVAGFDRSSFLIALGGGVVGDLAGFVAAIYHRGIPYLQVPTTLLAQVDSSIGGKTAVNTRAGKNLLGVVHQPTMVLADVSTLETLPPRELKQGFAEIIKHAVISDPSLFELLRDFEGTKLAELVRRNIEIKAGIIAQDEHDTTGERATLNFGHTVAHALERAAGYGTLLHGEAVSLGMVAACDVSVQRVGFPNEHRDRVIAALQAFDLPTRLPPAFPRNAILPALLSDKKFERGQVRFVVARALGSARLTSDVSIDDIARAIAQL